MLKPLAVVSIAIAGVLITSSVAFAIAEGKNPEGKFLDRDDAIIPGNPVPASAIDAFNFDNSSDWGSQDSLPSCGLDGGGVNPAVDYHPYGMLTVEISTVGDYTFRVVNSEVEDTFLALFSSDGFDPLNPSDNVVGCNDDGYNGSDPFEPNGFDLYVYPPTDSLWSQFEVEVTTPGTFTLVASTYDTFGSNDDWEGEVSVDAGDPASVTFECWGPAEAEVGSCLSAPELEQTQEVSASNGESKERQASSPAIALNLEAAPGSPVSQAEVGAGGQGLLPGTAYTLGLSGRASPLGSGTVNDLGNFGLSPGLASLLPGTYSLRLAATAPGGGLLVLVQEFVVDEEGLVTSISEASGSQQVTTSSPVLARTGASTGLAFTGSLGLGFLILGGILHLVARQRQA